MLTLVWIKGMKYQVHIFLCTCYRSFWIYLPIVMYWFSYINDDNLLGFVFWNLSRLFLCAWSQYFWYLPLSGCCKCFLSGNDVSFWIFANYLVTRLDRNLSAASDNICFEVSITEFVGVLKSIGWNFFGSFFIIWLQHTRLNVSMSSLVVAYSRLDL